MTRTSDIVFPPSDAAGYFQAAFRANIIGLIIIVNKPNLDKFFYNGDVVAQNADKIISFEADGTHSKTLAESVQAVVGADYGHVLYQRDDVIYDFNTLENETISLASAVSQGVIVGVDKINSSWLLIKRNRVSNDYLYECSSLN